MKGRTLRSAMLFNLSTGNYNTTKSVAELKVAISELLDKNVLTALNVRTGTNRNVGY